MATKQHVLAALSIAALLLAGCTAATPRPVPSTGTAAPADLATGLQAPWSIAFRSGLALVSERDSGLIKLVDPGTGAVREVGEVAGVVHGGEGGLLGLAVQGDLLYVYSTGPDGNRVQRFPLTGPVDSPGLGEPETVIDEIPSGRTHNGGRIAFGPDGMLYVATGDAQDRPLSQDPASLAGKILRLDPDGEIPSDNPFPGSPVFSMGHRNVQGLAWTADGTMYATEFGQSTWDELNRIVPAGNYGWPDVEGIAGEPAFIDPIAQWPTDEASPSGLAADGDDLIIANLRGRVLRVVSATDPTDQTDLLDAGRLRDVVVAPDGRWWVLTNNTDGRGDPSDGDDRILVLDPVSVTRPG